MTAYHEAGHAVVGSYLEHADPLHKVSIIPRGRALGVTFFLPTDDRIEYSKEWCLDTITHLLGGRVAEELVLKRIGTGAANDIRESSKLVRRMVTQWGMSDVLGPIAFGDRDEQIFLGKEIAVRKDYSEETAREIDAEVKRIIEDCHNRAKKILTGHEEELHRVAGALLERESLDADDIKILLNNGTLPPIKKRNNNHAPEPAPGERSKGEKAKPGEPAPAERPAGEKAGNDKGGAADAAEPGGGTGGGSEETGRSGNTGQP